MNEIEKKKTARESSVGADERQSVPKNIDTIISFSEEKINGNAGNNEVLDELRRKMLQTADPNYLRTMSMSELYETTFESRPPIVENLLYSGAYILAGTPKIGKSFLVAQIAYHVSTGEMLWNCEVNQGTVLYLALEDDYQRLQRRMFTMYNVEDTESLHFATVAHKIGKGLDEQLEFFMKEHPDTKLIIIDTMQKIRELGGEAYSYSNDYDIIGRLKKIADAHRICVLIVHHTRKAQSEDDVEKISGTMGLTGSADGSLLMQKKKRTSLEASLSVTGRDLQDQTYLLKKDPATLIWNLDRVENELYLEPPDKVLEAISKLVSEEQPEWSGSPTELALAINSQLAPNALSKHLNIQCGRLEDEYDIEYENKAKHSGRVITLTRIPSKDESLE